VTGFNSGIITGRGVRTAECGPHRVTIDDVTVLHAIIVSLRNLQNSLRNFDIVLA